MLCSRLRRTRLNSNPGRFHLIEKTLTVINQNEISTVLDKQWQDELLWIWNFLGKLHFPALDYSRVLTYVLISKTNPWAQPTRKIIWTDFLLQKRNHKKVTQSYDWIMDGLSIFYIPHENKKMNEIIVYCKVIVLRKINVFIQIKKLTWANKNFQWHCHYDRVFRKSRICGSSAFVDFDVMLGKIENIFVVNSCENVISNLVFNA